MLFCASAYLFKFSKRQHAVWVKRYLQKRQHYGVYNTLLADLAASDDQRLVDCREKSVRSQFHCFYLAQNLLKTRFSTRSPTRLELLDLSRHVKIIRSETGPRLFWSLTCLRHVCDLLKTCMYVFIFGDLVENLVLSRF